MSKASQSGCGCGSVGFPGALCLLFIGLKLGGVIDWSWLWVLSPLLICWIFALVCLALLGLIVFLES